MNRFCVMFSEILFETKKIGSFDDLCVEDVNCPRSDVQPSVNCMETSFGLESTTPRTYVRPAVDNNCELIYWIRGVKISDFEPFAL